MTTNRREFLAKLAAPTAAAVAAMAAYGYTPERTHAMGTVRLKGYSITATEGDKTLTLPAGAIPEAIQPYLKVAGVTGYLVIVREDPTAPAGPPRTFALLRVDLDGTSAPFDDTSVIKVGACSYPVGYDQHFETAVLYERI